MDFHDARTVLVQVDDTAVIAVLDDACAATSILQPWLEGIEGPLTKIQLRELAARLAYTSVFAMPRPEFFYAFDGTRVRLSVRRGPRMALVDEDRAVLSEFLTHACGGLLAASTDPERDKKLEGLRDGSLSFVYNNGQFIRESFVASDPS